MQTWQDEYVKKKNKKEDEYVCQDMGDHDIYHSYENASLQ